MKPGRRELCDHTDNGGGSAFRTMARWADTADRRWTEDECRRCGLLRRFVNGRFWRRKAIAA